MSYKARYFEEFHRQIISKYIVNYSLIAKDLRLAYFRFFSTLLYSPPKRRTLKLFNFII